MSAKELQREIRKQRAKLAKLQRDIANGRPPELPPGKNEIFEWHPTIPDLAARVYKTGHGVWRQGYRTNDRQKGTEHLGNMAVVPLELVEKKARAFLQEIADGRNPQAERRKLRLRPKRTVAQLFDEFFAEMSGNPEMAASTIQGYRSAAKYYLDILGDIQCAELTPQDVATRVREVHYQRDPDQLHVHRRGVLGAGRGGPWAAQQLRAAISSVFNWALGVYPDEIKVNPVKGTWSPPRMKSTGEALTMEEVGAVWRGCEVLDAMAVPMCRNGHAMKPGQHIDAPDDRLMSCREAARLTGLHQRVFYNAVEDGRLPYQMGGTGRMQSAWLISVGDINRFLDSRPQRSQRGDYSKVVRLVTLFGARFDEMGALRFSELECDCAECRKRRRKFPFRFLHIPTVLPDGTRRLKSRGGKPKDLVLYLPPSAIALIDSVKRRAGCGLLFGPSDGSGALSNGALKADLDAAIERNEGAPLCPDENGKPRWKHHWLRHTFESRLKDDLECPPWVVAAMVNHTGEDISRVDADYTHVDYLQLQKRYLDIWDKYIRDVADRVEDDETNVHRLSRPAESA